MTSRSSLGNGRPSAATTHVTVKYESQPAVSVIRLTRVMHASQGRKENIYQSDRWPEIRPIVQSSIVFTPHTLPARNCTLLRQQAYAHLLVFTIRMSIASDIELMGTALLANHPFHHLISRSRAFFSHGIWTIATTIVRDAGQELA